MERSQYEQIAVGAGLLAILAAIVTGRMPRWLRIVFVIGVVIVASGAGLFGYRTYNKPVTLTVAAGSLDGEAGRLMSAIATKLASTNAPVRLKVLDKPTSLEAAMAFAADQADLTILRADIRTLPDARAVVLVTHAVVLLIGLPGTSIDDIDSLKGKAVGVVGEAVNHNLISVISKEYDLARAKVQFKDVALPDVAQAIKTKQIQALLVVTPVSDRYLTLLRAFWPRTSKMQLVEIDSAGAIAAIDRAYESYDLPKGTIWGSPATPKDDLTTLRVPLYLVANKKLSNDTVGALTKAIMDTRRDLMSEYPLLSQIASPGTDKDAYIPTHPGAAAYFDGDTQSFFDKYGDQIFYGSMLLGTLTSMFAAAWKFMSKDEDPSAHPIQRLYALVDQIAAAKNESELSEIERKIDEALVGELQKCTAEDANASETTALDLVTRRLEHLIEQRRAILRSPLATTAA